MRYAIFSDVHANRQAWEAVREDAQRMGADTLVCLGDVVGYGPKPLEVLAAVREATPNFVLGNHDAAACGRLDASIFNDRARTVIEWTRERLDEESLEFLNQVPLQMDGNGVLFVHAEVMEPGEFGYVDGPGPAQLNMRAMTKPIAFLGHTHLPMAYSMPKKGGQVKQLPPKDFQLERGMRTLVNVGSVGEPRTTDVRASYVIYDDAEKTVTFRKVEFDVDAYRADLEETGLDIRPYFVQVVEAGRVAGAPQPTAAPQMALAHLPKVAEVVAGHHGHLVLGQAGQAPAWGAGPSVPLPSMKKKGVPGWAIAAMVAFLLICVAGIAIYSSRKDRDLAVQDPVAPSGGAEKKLSPKEPRRGADKPPGSPDSPNGADSGGTGVPIKALELKVFARKFKSLEELRAADDNGKPDRKVDVGGGLIAPGLVSETGDCGIVWEGDLNVPKTGDYDFTVTSASGAALFLTGYKEGEIKASGGTMEKKVRLRKGLPSIRVEVLRKDAVNDFSLTWSGPGLEGVQSLVLDGPGTSKAPSSIASQDPKRMPVEPEPEPEPELKSAEKISEDLVSYWAFDSAGDQRVILDPKTGIAVEWLVATKGQEVRVLIPKKDIGSRWKEWRFNHQDWTMNEDGNGLGYEDKPGEYKDLIKTPIGRSPGKHPHTVYIRMPFEIEDPKAYSDLKLYMKYDDAFIAYLNGKQLAQSEHAPGVPGWNTGAKASNGDKNWQEFEEKKVGRHLAIGTLKKGPNVLAIQAFNVQDPKNPKKDNASATSSDMLIVTELRAQLKDSGSVKPPELPAQPELVVSAKDLKGKVTPVSGKFGDAYAFKEGSIEVGSKDDYAMGEGSFSVSLWFTRDSNSIDNKSRRLISAGGGGAKNAGWELRLTRKVDGVTFAVSDGTTRDEVPAKAPSMGDGNWRHVAVSVDRPSQRVSIFIDGDLVEDRVLAVLEAAEISSGSGLSIGRNSDGADHHRGKLDDVAIWQRALTPEEVQLIFESGEDEKALREIFDEKAD